MNDLRYAIRSLRNSPGFSVTSVAVLALAIGANTAMFSVLHAVLLRPIPYQSPDQLAMLWSEVPGEGVREGRTAYRTIEEWRRHARSFSGIAFFDPVSATLTGATGAEHISVTRISPDLFSLLGVQPLLGRSFTVAEAEDRQRVALISERMWRSRFGGAQDVIGATIELDGRPSEIIGVMPATVLADGDVWEPHTTFPDWDALRRTQGLGSWFVVGRLRPSVTFDQAQAEMSAIARRLDEQSAASGMSPGVTPVSLQIVGPKSRLALWMLTGAVFCVLLMAATNVASLSLARFAQREREMAVRAALGAGPLRIMRQLLIESLTLSFAAGLLGLLVAVAGIRFILAVRSGNLYRLDEVALDPHALGWALALCVLTGVLVGLAPAAIAARRDITASGQEGGRAIAGGVAARGTRRALVVTEVALAIMLLSGAGLLLRSLRSVQSVHLGFRPERVLSVQLSTPPMMPSSQRVGFYERALGQIESMPGAASAGIIADLFIGGTPEQLFTAESDGRPVRQRFRFRRDEISPGLFSAISTPLLKGRFFTAADGPDAPRVAIVNDALARRVWPGRDPVGLRFRLGASDSGPWFTVVGVVGDMRRQGLESEPVPQIFEPMAQNPSRLATLLVRTTAEDPATIAAPVRAAVQSVDKNAPVYGAMTLEHRLGDFLAARRFQTALLIGFSAVALLLAAIGIYGLIQYSVSTRTHEIGIRIAVGAHSRDIFAMVIREGVTLSLAGLCLGLFGALWLSQAGSSLLYGVTATDPLTFTSVSVVLMAVAMAACYFPARRAMKVDPAVALRQE